MKKKIKQTKPLRLSKETLRGLSGCEPEVQEIEVTHIRDGATQCYLVIVVVPRTWGCP